MGDVVRRVGGTVFVRHVPGGGVPLTYEDWTECPICGSDALKTTVAAFMRDIPTNPMPILTELILDLRAVHRPILDLDGEPRLCLEGCGVMPCPSLIYADRAEARLREIDG